MFDNEGNTGESQIQGDYNTSGGLNGWRRRQKETEGYTAEEETELGRCIHGEHLTVKKGESLIQRDHRFGGGPVPVGKVTK